MILGRFCVSVTSESKLLNIHYEWQCLVTGEFKCVSWCILEAPETGAFSKSGRSELLPLLMLFNAISCHQGTVCEINLFLQHSFNNIPMRVRFKFPFYSVFCLNSVFFQEQICVFFEVLGSVVLRADIILFYVTSHRWATICADHCVKLLTSIWPKNLLKWLFIIVLRNCSPYPSFLAMSQLELNMMMMMMYSASQILSK